MEADKSASSLSHGIYNDPQDFHLNTFLTHTEKNATQIQLKVSMLNNSSFNPLIPGVVPCSPSRDYQSKKAL